MKLRNIALRNIKRNIRRSILSASATAVATMTIVLLFAYIGGMTYDMEFNISTYYSGHIRLRHAEFDDYENLNPIHLRIENYGSLLNELSGLEGVSDVSPRILFPAGIYENEETFGAIGLGVDFAYEQSFMNTDAILRDGTMPSPGKNEVLVGAGLAAELGLDIGEKFTVLTTTMRRGSNAMTFTVSGIVVFPVAAMNNTHFLAPLDRVQKLTQMKDSVSEILVKIDNNRQLKAIQDEVTKVVSGAGYSDVSVKNWKQANIFAALFSYADTIYGIIGIVFLLLASTVLINTTMMVIFERMREIGTIAAMGMKGKEIVRLFFLEAMFLTIIGALAGTILGVGIAGAFGQIGIDMGAALEGMDFEISNIIYPRINVVMTIVVFFYSIAVCSAVSVIPSRRAATIEPVEALRHI